MLAELTLGAVEPLIGKSFRVQLGEASAVEVALITAARLPQYAGGSAPPRREPFALVFRGPMELMLPQRTYDMEEESLGRLQIFLVPIGPDEAGQRYEAVFN